MPDDHEAIPEDGEKEEEPDHRGPPTSGDLEGVRSGVELEAFRERDLWTGDGFVGRGCRDREKGVAVMATGGGKLGRNVFGRELRATVLALEFDEGVGGGHGWI